MWILIFPSGVSPLFPHANGKVAYRARMAATQDVYEVLCRAHRNALMLYPLDYLGPQHDQHVIVSSHMVKHHFLYCIFGRQEQTRGYMEGSIILPMLQEGKLRY